MGKANWFFITIATHWRTYYNASYYCYYYEIREFWAPCKFCTKYYLKEGETRIALMRLYFRDILFELEKPTKFERFAQDLK